MSRRVTAVAVWVGLGLAGCAHIGPQTIVDDRVPYNDAIATSWKQQTLLNLVRLRYLDTPEFVDVPSVVSGYSLDRTASAAFGFEDFPHGTANNFFNFGLSASRTTEDRPTISYAPQTGAQFIRNLTNPLPPVSILSVIESGTPADTVLELTMESINGVRNSDVLTADQRDEDAVFRFVARTIRKAQASGAVSLRIQPEKDKKEGDLFFVIRDQTLDPALAADLDKMRQQLRMHPARRELRVVYGTLPKDDSEIAFKTRSVMRMFVALANYVQVPDAHLADGSAPVIPPIITSPDLLPLTVRCGCDKPCDAYAAVKYRGYWYWIDQSDSNSKRTFIYLKVLLAIADTGPKEAGPALTIRAN
jgi:hypothetical protein